MKKQKFKKGDWLIARWREMEKETDIALFTNYVDGDHFMYSRFYRVETPKDAKNLSMDTKYPVEINDYRYSLKWRKMTNQEKVKYFGIILQNI